MNRRDFEREPCSCGECVQAGVMDHKQLRDPETGRWMHGYTLKAWYLAAERCLETARKMSAPKVDE